MPLARRPPHAGIDQIGAVATGMGPQVMAAHQITGRLSSPHHHPAPVRLSMSPGTIGGPVAPPV